MLQRRPHLFRSAYPIVSSLTLAVLLGACGDGNEGRDATQVAASVNGEEITVAQLEHVLRYRAAAASDRDDAARRILERLVDEEIAAQQARKQGLDRDPRVIQAIEAAKREVLARAYEDTLTEKAELPPSDEIDRYYDSQPALFAQRRFYSLQETAVEGTPEQLQALGPRLEGADDAARAATLLREAGLRFRMRQVTVSPEDVPLALLERLAQLREGQTMIVPQPGGARVLMLLSSQPAPLGRAEARAAIRAFLVGERKRESATHGMNASRDAARVEYKGRFAQAPLQAASAPAQ